jgi:wyosine [tRNA(Phe)-imidazoG37] synthetase (radical SAM superfamily)
MIHYLFGPVPSRRLGRSLGIDLVPFKTCTYDCIYCQLGLTTCKTIERKPWVPLEKVLAELRVRLSSKPDYITLSGSGEPTLHSQVGELISEIKTITDIPVAVLTNGSMLWQEDLRRQLLRADLVIPSLDAGSESVFQAVTRPHSRISFRQMLDGLVAFRNEFSGQYWLEAMLLRWYTTTDAEIGNLAECVERIQPDRFQLNTVTRPPAEEYAVRVSRERLTKISKLFRTPAEVITDFHDIHGESDFVGSREEVLAMLQRRPCSVEDIAQGLGIHRNEAIKHLEELRVQSGVEVSTSGDEQYFGAIH